MNKMPLGKVSSKQIKKAYSLISQLDDVNKIHLIIDQNLFSNPFNNFNS